ncbi:site-specific integrase [Hymenobacter terricola]|uniref:site-specific integrase n=1 Tax=Hymenobacter terricola TaxID=2819236 RepID=UPI001CF1D909|nr:site-specific integrase [Hymenobacter terricola]
MSKISFILRPANTNGESPVSIKHTHSTLTPFTKATGVSVPSQYFNLKTGKVSNKLPGYVEKNAAIEQVRADVEKAARNVMSWDEHPDRETVAKEYNAIVQGRINTAANLRIVRDDYVDFAEQLRAEIADLETQLEEKKTELRDYEMSLGTFEGKLVSTFIERYRDTQKLTVNTKRAYNNLARYVRGFRSHWEITDVTPDTLIEFENYLISIRLNNSSINQQVKRVKTVCIKYANLLQLNTQALKEHRTESKQLRKQDVLFLTTHELELFKALEVPKRREIVKDAFLLMAYTGLRFSDHILTPNNIKGNYIVLTTQKTKTLVKIPMSDSAKAILEKYDYTMPKQYLANFSKVLKALAKQAGLNELIHTQKKIGAEIVESYEPKHKLISAHVARKTFITHALSAGVNPAVLKLWIGHSKMELMFSNYASGQMNTVSEMEKITTI